MPGGQYVKFSPKAINSNYTVTFEDDCLLVTTGSSNKTISLPKASKARAGKAILIQKVDSGTGAVVISAATGDSIDGASSVNITSQYAKKLLISTGSGWLAISSS
jgi:hypothetical protein